MTEDELITEVTNEIKGLSTHFDATDYAQAVDDAERDTGFTLPATDDGQIKWLKRRTKRHLFYMLWTESAHKFKFEQINLQHRFEHYKQLIEKEDLDFEKALEDEILFADVNDTQLFGHKIDAGFSQDDYGRDTTYDEDNLVAVTPTDSD
jgi:hypothetical protein